MKAECSELAIDNSAESSPLFDVWMLVRAFLDFQLVHGSLNELSLISHFNSTWRVPSQGLSSGWQAHMMSRVSHQYLSFIEVPVKEQLINSLLKYSVKNLNYVREILYKCTFQRNTSVHVCSLPTHFSMSRRSGRKARSQAKHPELLIVCSTKQNSVVTETCETATQHEIFFNFFNEKSLKKKIPERTWPMYF